MNEEILKCDKVLAYLCVFGFLIIAATLIFFSIKLALIPYEKPYERPSFHFPIWLITCIASPLLLIAVGVNIKYIIQIKMAPKLYLDLNYTIKEKKEE